MARARSRRLARPSLRRGIGSGPGSRPSADEPAEAASRLAGGETVALALLARASERRRHGLVGSRALYLNETGDPRFEFADDRAQRRSRRGRIRDGSLEALLAWFAELREEADELHLSGSLWRWPDDALEARGLRRNETAVPPTLSSLAPSHERWRALSGAQRQCAPAASARR